MTEARKKRLREARAWFAVQGFTDDSHIVKAYRQRFRVDKTCAMRELCLLKVLSPEKQAAYEAELNAKRQKRRKAETDSEDPLSSSQDENFAFIAGYTPGGFPYGITWEEQAESEKKEYGDLNDESDIEVF